MLPRKDANRNYRAHKEDGRLHRRKEDAPELRRHCALRGDDIRGVSRFEIGGVSISLRPNETRSLRQVLRETQDSRVQRVFNQARRGTRPDT